jgi:hypothetical protein
MHVVFVNAAQATTSPWRSRAFPEQLPCVIATAILDHNHFDRLLSGVTLLRRQARDEHVALLNVGMTTESSGTFVMPCA